MSAGVAPPAAGAGVCVFVGPAGVGGGGGYVTSAALPRGATFTTPTARPPWDDLDQQRSYTFISLSVKSSLVGVTDPCNSCCQLTTYCTMIRRSLPNT